MVHGMAGSAVDDGAIGNVFPIVDEDGPEVDEAEKDHIGEFLEGQNEREDMIRHTLWPAIERVEGVGREWRGHDPPVMRLVQSSVDERVMQPTVNPVDKEIRKQDEYRELNDVVEWEWSVFSIIV